MAVLGRFLRAPLLLLLISSVSGAEHNHRRHSEKEHVDESSDLNHLGFEAEDALFVDDVMEGSPYRRGEVGAALAQQLKKYPDLVTTRSRTKRTAIHTDDKLWPYGRVPYIFSPEVQRSAVYRDAILEAMAHIEDVTCVRFVKENRHYGRTKKLVKFLRGNSCHSSVGKSDGVGEQEVTLSRTCAYPEMVIHELGHLLGLWHEHARTDRDNNVLVLINNVRANYDHNFDKASPMRLFAPYDLSSMMHYDMQTFSANGDPTITPMDQDMAHVIGQKQEFSFYDQFTLNALYNCSESCTDAPVCQHGGFLSKMCNCVCPAGLTGDSCQTVDTDPTCGGVLDITDTLEVTSPGYPNNYPNRAECRWLLKSAPGTVMTLEITDLEIEKSSRGTCRDQLEVRYHHIGVSPGPVYCGTSLNKTFETTTNYLVMRFYSNVINSKRGFHGIVSVKPKTVCSEHPCLNGGICHDIASIGTHYCQCQDTWVGQNCDRHIRDGGWSDWTPWTLCAAACGKQSRHRTCTNPSAENGGRDCVGPHYQSRDCGTPSDCQGAFSCDFGTADTWSLCGMVSEEKTDQLDWQAHQGATSSLNTGPVSGHTTGDNNDTYLYLEASFGKAYDDAILWLPAMNLKMGLHCLQFFYNMRGDSMGTLLVFRKISKSRAVVMWQRSGDQGKDWNEVNVDVLFFRKIDVGIMAVRGDTYSSDIAIDDISLSPGACHDPEHNSYGSYGCKWGNRRYRVGPFIASDDCIQLNCFCNPDGHVDCPKWQNESVCQPLDLQEGSNSLSSVSGDGASTWKVKKQHTSGVEQRAGLDKEEWPHWLRVAHSHSKKRRGKRTRKRV